MRLGEKRGVSPVIASMLMILLVLVLATIIFLWARGFIGEQIEKFGTPIETYCGQVRFNAALYGNNLEVLNEGDVSIHSFNLKMMKGGDSEVSLVALPVDAGETGSGNINLKMEDGDLAEEIMLYPVLVGNVRGETRNNVFTCIDSGVNLL